MGKISDLNKHIFDALDDLAKCKDNEDYRTQIQRCNAVANMGKVLVDEMKAGIEIAKLQEKGNDYADYMPTLLGLDDDDE